jgi:hypothetical protein
MKSQRINKGNIRDRISQLEYNRNKKSNEDQRTISVLVTILSVGMAIYIFELVKLEKNVPLLIFLTFVLITVGAYVFLHKPTFKEDKEVRRLYNILLKNNKKKENVNKPDGD